MRLPLIGMSFAVFVFLGTLAAAQGPEAQRFPGQPGPPPGGDGCQLVRAQWGAGNQNWDVTPRLRSMIRGNQLNFKVNNTNLGGDPAQGLTKTLRITCRDWRGQTNTHHYREGDYVNLQVVSADYYRLRVMNATWGASGQTWNVTDRVNRMINGGRLSFKVNNTNLGGDPAQGRSKQFVMSWMYAGRRGNQVWREGDYVNLP
ncbi:MAG TPA: hypothetical protein VLW84_10140 [Terriglobales bacterium]|nr:hypothetical protein [Terriglobales bacterium]